MELQDFARLILFEGHLAAKLQDPGTLTDGSVGAPIPIPPAPARAIGLRFPARGERVRTPLPSMRDLEREHERAVLLHFFANHELLALELMALALLRFPHAPTKFRRGLAGTMLEEQRHLNLYLTRMRTFGLDFGHVPVNRYFWDVIADTPSPLAFVTQMSLTLEQANLDFSKYYTDLFRRLGDTETTQILETVYNDEIGHVRHGLQWFNLWRPEGTSEWTAYKSCLPLPLTPARAKGTIYDVEARQRAGLSDEFIQELSIYHHSKGRPPRVFWFNPEFEDEIALGPNFIPGKALRKVQHDLASLMMLLAGHDDVVLVPERPSTAFLATLQEAGFGGCQVAGSIKELDGRLIQGFEPWGQSPSAVRLAASTSATSVESLSAPLDRRLGSKVWAKELARAYVPNQTPGTLAYSEDETRRLLETDFSTGTAVIKAPYGTAGRNAIRVPPRVELTPQQAGWLANIFRTQKAVVIEPWLDRVADFSVQISVGGGAKDCLGITRFLTSPRGQYVGHVLGRKLENLSPDVVRAYHEQDVPAQLIKVAKAVAEELAQAGYKGPAGIDALLYRDAHGIHLYPLVEINARYTMGRIALALDKRIHSSASATWCHISRVDIERQGYASFQDFARTLGTGIPIEHKNGCLTSGIVFTNDPHIAQGVLSVLFVGEEALKRAPTLEAGVILSGCLPVKAEQLMTIVHKGP